MLCHWICQKRPVSWDSNSFESDRVCAWMVGTFLLMPSIHVRMSQKCGIDLYGKAQWCVFHSRVW